MTWSARAHFRPTEDFEDSHELVLSVHQSADGEIADGGSFFGVYIIGDSELQALLEGKSPPEALRAFAERLHVAFKYLATPEDKRPRLLESPYGKEGE